MIDIRSYINQLRLTRNRQFEGIAEALEQVQQEMDGVRSTQRPVVAESALPSASSTPPGDISFSGTPTYSHLSGGGGVGTTEIRFVPIHPAPIGTYRGFVIYVEDPDQSGVPLLKADGSTPWDGSNIAAGESKPIFAGRYTYNQMDPDAPAIGVIPYRGVSRTIRIKAVSYSDEATNSYESAPSTTLTITIDSPPKPNSGTAWTENATGITAPVMYLDTVDGRVKRYLIFDGIVIPEDSRFAGWSIWSSGWPDDPEFYRMCPDQVGPRVVVEMDEPAETLTLKFFLVSSGFGKDGKPHLNPIVDGITPSVLVTVGTTTGVLDIKKAFGFNNAEFEIDPANGGFRIKSVDFTKGTGFSTSEFEVSNGAFRVKELAATKIKTGVLSVGGPGMVSKFAIFAGDGSALGFIGDESAIGYQGAWLKRLLVGGTSPWNAPFFADLNGNVVCQSIYVNSASVPLGWIGADPVNPSTTGAWFKKVYIGGSSPGTAKIVADSNGDLTIHGSLIVDASMSVGKLTHGTATFGGAVTLDCGDADLTLKGGTIYIMNGVTELARITAGGFQTSGARIGAGICSVDYGMYTGIAGMSAGTGPSSAYVWAGYFRWSDLNSTSSATGGSAAPLPAQPVGYLKIMVGGAEHKIPYYS